MNLPPCLVQWILGFVSNRKSRVKLGEFLSEWFEVSSGTPQGTVLAPLIFALFVSDLPDNLKSTCILYADDTKMFVKVPRNGQERHAAARKLQQDLEMFYQWCTTWGLPLNISKCAHMRFGKASTFRYSLNGQEIPVVEEYRDLGVIVDRDLKFDKHINHLIRHFALLVCIATHLSYSPKSFRILVTTYIRPILEYCSSIWNPYLVGQCEKIENVQRCALRILDGVHHQNLSYDQKLQIACLPTLQVRRCRGDLIETFKIIRGFYNLDCSEFFKFVADVHQYPTTGHNMRIRANHYSYRNTDRQKNWFCDRVATTWNSLPQAAVDSESVNSFKNAIDIYLHLQ